MAKKVPQNNNQDWNDNPLISSSDAAVKQAVAPFLDWVKLRRNTSNKFDDKGRPDHIFEWVDFQCIVIPDGSRSRSMTSSGDRSSQYFTVMYLKPARLNMGDEIWHKEWGHMKIEGYDGLSNLGLTTSRAVALDACNDVVDGDTLKNDSPNIF